LTPRMKSTASRSKGLPFRSRIYLKV
jgi:hypothetical protein